METFAHHFWTGEKQTEKTKEELENQLKREEHDISCLLGEKNETVKEINKVDHGWISQFAKSPFYDQTLGEKANLTRAASIIQYFVKNGLPESLKKEFVSIQSKQFIKQSDYHCFLPVDKKGRHMTGTREIKAKHGEFIKLSISNASLDDLKKTTTSNFPVISTRNYLRTLVKKSTRTKKRKVEKEE